MSSGIKIVAAVIGFAILAAAVWLLVRELSASPSVEIARTSQITAWSGLDFYPVISPDGRTLFVLEHDALQRAIAAATVCVVPFHDVDDLRQTYPVKVLEYMAAELPTVS